MHSNHTTGASELASARDRDASTAAALSVLRDEHAAQQRELHATSLNLARCEEQLSQTATHADECDELRQRATAAEERAERAEAQAKDKKRRDLESLRKHNEVNCLSCDM